jgi:hypothetical protein
MKTIAAICLLVFCTAAVGAVIYDESNFNALGRVFQSAPQEHASGRNNGPGHGTHHPGEECGACHSPGMRAEAYPWTMAGTLYSDRAGQAVRKNGEIIIQDRQGNVISMTANEAGNFWTDMPIASDPYAVSSHGGTTEKLYTEDDEGNLVQPADPDDPRTWLYKAWVRSRGDIRPMVTIAPVGGSAGMNMRMSCNMHHARLGSRAALWASPKATLPSYPAAGLSYRKHIFPILRSKCSPCHIPGNTTTRLVTKADLQTPSTSMDYSNGLDLMTYEGSTVRTVAKKGVLSEVNTSNPDQSPLLQKTVHGGTHGGGAFWDNLAPDYVALSQWISEGALKN